MISVRPKRIVSPSRKPPPAADALAVDERAVSREAVVDERALGPDELELGVQARDLGVPVEAEVGRLAAPDPHRLDLGADHDQHLLALGVAVHEERPAEALGLDLRLELGGGAGPRLRGLRASTAANLVRGHGRRSQPALLGCRPLFHRMNVGVPKETAQSSAAWR